MGYGGTGYATVDVDIVQTDVDAIVDGLTGSNERTLSDLEVRLLNIEGYLYDGFYSAADWLSYIASNTYGSESYLSGFYSGPLTDMVWELGYIEDHLYYDGYSAAYWLRQIQYDTSSTTGYLYDSSSGYSAAELLAQIESNTYGLDSIDDYLYYNQGVFRNFAVGEVLFLGAAGSKRGEEDWEISFKFAASPNVVNLVVGDIASINKKGWEYLWVLYEHVEDAAAQKLVQRPLAAYVEKVYEYGDFAGLGI